MGRNLMDFVPYFYGLLALFCGIGDCIVGLPASSLVAIIPIVMKD